MRRTLWRLTLNAGLVAPDRPKPGWVIWLRYSKPPRTQAEIVRGRWLGVWLGYRTVPLWSERSGARSPCHRLGSFAVRFSDGWQNR